MQIVWNEQIINEYYNINTMDLNARSLCIMHKVIVSHGKNS